MLYLVGGVPRTGKSYLAQRILVNARIPYVSTDALFHMLKKAAPSLGLTDKVPLKQKAELFYPFLEQFAKYAPISNGSYLVEGDAFLPHQVNALAQKYEVRACFLGFSKADIDIIIRYSGNNKWVSDLSVKEQGDLSEWLGKESASIQEQCKKYGIAYFDVSKNYETAINQAYEYLIK